MLNGIFWILHTGAQWHELPQRYGPWKTAHGRFRRWAREGLFDRILERLRVRLDVEGRIGWDPRCVDGTNVRASRSAVGGPKGGTPRNPKTTLWAAADGGYGTKIVLVTDGNGHPLSATLLPGQAHESVALEPALRAVRIGRRTRLGRLAGDKGLSYPRVRRWLRRHRIAAVIATRSDQRPDPSFDREAYRGRNVVERCVGWLKENRRLGTRYEKLASSFLAMVQLAIIRRYLHLLGP